MLSQGAQLQSVCFAVKGRSFKLRRGGTSLKAPHYRILASEMVNFPGTEDCQTKTKQTHDKKTKGPKHSR